MYNYRAFILLIVGIFLISCSDDETVMQEEEPPEVEINWRETHTISEVINNFSGVITDTVIVSALVSSTDVEGNIQNQLFIQDSEAALVVNVESNNVSAILDRGIEVFFLLTGLNFDSNNQNIFNADLTPLTEETLEAHTNVTDEDRSVTFEVVTDLTKTNEIANHKLIKAFGLQFEELQTGEPLFNSDQDVMERALTDDEGNEIFLRISKEASFTSDEVPFESGSIEGILVQESDRDVIIPFTSEDLNFSSQRHSLFVKEEFTNDGFTLPYQIMFPRGYDKNDSEKYPLVFFLHGAGERGTNNTSQMANGPQVFNNQMAREDYPAIVVFPQCPPEFMWSRRTRETIDGELIFTFPVEEEADLPMLNVIELTNQLIANEAVDENRVYVMGLSMGGIGTLEYLYYAPNIPAAAISIAGGHDPEQVSVYGNDVSIRLYHGSNDGVVPPRYSRELIEALDQLPMEDAEYFEAEGRGHEWNYILNSPEDILPWLWSKSKE
ncbi:MAG: DUF5689 domain-containing protein [Bacteroidota bacterium]